MAFWFVSNSRYWAMERAFESMLLCDNLTSFALPVVPDVDNRTLRSGVKGNFPMIWIQFERPVADIAMLVAIILLAGTVLLVDAALPVYGIRREGIKDIGVFGCRSWRNQYDGVTRAHGAKVGN